MAMEIGDWSLDMFMASLVENGPFLVVAHRIRFYATPVQSKLKITNTMLKIR